MPTGTQMTRTKPDGSVVIDTPNGEVTFQNPETYRWAMSQMGGSRGNGGGGGGGGRGVSLDLGTIVDAGQAVYAGMTAAQISEQVKDAKRAKKKLKEKVGKLVLAAKSSTSLPSSFATELEATFKAQSRLDAEQTRALAAVVKAEVIQALGGGAKVLANVVEDGGLDGGTAALGAGVLGFGMASLLSDGDDDSDD